MFFFHCFVFIVLYNVTHIYAEKEANAAAKCSHDICPTSISSFVGGRNNRFVG